MEEKEGREGGGGKGEAEGVKGQVEVGGRWGSENLGDVRVGRRLEMKRDDRRGERGGVRGTRRRRW